MNETEMHPKGQKPSVSSHAGLSKNMIIPISVIIGGGLVIGLAVGFGVGLGVGLNDVETASEAKTKEMKTTETTTSPSTGTGSTASSVTPYDNTSQCDFNVSGICYWSYLDFDYIPFTEAQQICADKGSVPAYFPTELVYNKTVESVRAIDNGISGNMYMYTGVMVDEQTLNVTYPDTEVYMKWNPGYPDQCTDCTSVLLSISLYYRSTSSGMLNVYRSVPKGVNGVVCQNNLN